MTQLIIATQYGRGEGAHTLTLVASRLDSQTSHYAAYVVHTSHFSAKDVGNDTTEEEA